MATATEIWAFHGMADKLVACRVLADEIHRIHGLRVGEPLEVAENLRSTGTIEQVVTEVAGTVVVERQ